MAKAERTHSNQSAALSLPVKPALTLAQLPVSEEELDAIEAYLGLDFAMIFGKPAKQKPSPSTGARRGQKCSVESL